MLTMAMGAGMAYSDGANAQARSSLKSTHGTGFRDVRVRCMGSMPEAVEAFTRERARRHMRARIFREIWQRRLPAA
jgi:hypothetical protein